MVVFIDIKEGSSIRVLEYDGESLPAPGHPIIATKVFQNVLYGTD